jgi:translocation and assembly module TamB
VLALVAALLAAMIAGWWLTQTSSGSRWLWHRATPMIPGELGARSISGSLGDGLDLGDLSYASDGVNVDIANARIAAKLVLFPLSINVRHLRAENVVIRLKETSAPDEPGGPILEKLSLPFILNVEDAVVRKLQVRNSADKRIFGVDSAALAGRWYDHILLTRLDIDSDAGVVGGTMRLGLARPHAAEASLSGTYPLKLGDAPAQILQIRAAATGSLADLHIDVSSDRPDVHIAGQLFRLTETPRWDVQVQSPWLQWPLAANPDRPPQVTLRDTDLRSAGDLAGFSIEGDGAVSVAGTEELRFRIVTEGTRDGLQVSDLQLQGDMLKARSVGEILWSQGFAIAADADVERFDVGVLTDRWPAGQPVSGTVDATWRAGNVRLNEVRLRVEGAPAKVDATGQIDLEGGVVDLDLDWQNLQWPMADTGEAEVTRLISEFGRVQVAGKPEEWLFDGRIAFRTNTLPQGVFVLSGAGNRNQVEAILSESQVLGGSAAGRGSYNWTENGRWSAELVTENLDISPLAPDFPGRISSEFSAEGQRSPVQFEVRITRLQGTVRNQPLQGEGGIRYVDGNLDARQLRIISGESELLANGSLRTESGLDFTLDVAALETFHPEVAGTVRASGNLSMADEFPLLRLDLEAADLYWGDYALQQLDIASVAGPADLPLSLEATGNSLLFGTRELESFSLQLGAGANRQRLQAELSSGDQEVHVELDGRLEDWQRPLQSVWTGQLRSARFDAPDDLHYALQEPADLRLSAALVSLEQACLAGNTDSRVCLEASWRGGGNFATAAQMDAVPVDLLNLVYDTGLTFSQALSGGFSIGSSGEGLSGEGRIDISPGQVLNRVDSRLSTRTGAGELGFNLADGQLLSGRLTLPFSDAGRIDARFEAADISRGADSAIQGQLKAGLEDIAVAANIAPMIDEVRGRLDVDLAIAGTLGKPLVTGETTLRGGAVRFEPLGLKLTDIELQSVIREDNRIELQTTFRAGDGTGQLQSSLGTAGIRDGINLSLTGEGLTLIDLPDINVVADTDLALGIASDGLTINGNILVPRARLSPVDLTSGGKISESEDVVIVANGEGEIEPTGGNGAPFRMAGTVALVLGKDVIVDLDVAEARVSGTSAFHWDGPHMPVANGQYSIEGRFEAYGQLLDITEGTIRFPGVPASSPNLRIRAEREIFGNPQIRSAGVLVTGTPTEPVVEVYTNPATSRDRALTLLVTGSDFNYEQGVGAVDVGTYIAPDLFISYGIGLFERGNVISVRYDIAKGFGIKATSGKNAEGVDLSYTLER